MPVRDTIIVNPHSVLRLGRQIDHQGSGGKYWESLNVPTAKGKMLDTHLWEGKRCLVCFSQGQINASCL